MAQLPVPRLAEQITPEWLTAILSEGGHLGAARVTGVTLTEIGAGRGFVGLTLRIVPEYDRPAPDAPQSLVAKLPTPVAYDPSYGPLIALLYSTEIQWYRDMAPTCPVRVPRCYGGVMAPDEGCFVLLLEDLGHLGMLDQATSCSDDQARVIVRELARLHARWWEHPDLRTSPWLPQPEFQLEMVGGLIDLAWASFWERLGPRLDPRFEEVGLRLRAQVRELVADGAASASTLVHGDYRIENFMFGEPGTADELVVLDWQIAGRGSGARDLAYFTAQSLTPEARRRLEPGLIRLYHETLAAEGVTGYSVDNLALDYKRGLLIAMWIPVNGVRALDTSTAPDDPVELELFQKVMEAGEALITMIAERNVAAVLENDAASVLA
jgi:hypothetical protein